MAQEPHPKDAKSQGALPSIAEVPGTAGEDSREERFEIDASVVFQLGESLITDSVQALMELVKNSYDADASYCKVTINTAPINDDKSPFDGASGSIAVEDDGDGMTLSAIRSGWLTISNSEKRRMKARALTTHKGRTPLGDKGLGRLGTQRLGRNLEMITKTADSTVQQHVWFSWAAFTAQSKLSEVDIKRVVEPPTMPKGTRLIISELRDSELWSGDGVKDLEVRLSQMISPYKAVRNFVVMASVNGTALDLLEIPDKLRQLAQVRYSLKFDGELFRINGRCRLAYLRPDAAATPEDKATFASLIEEDGGAAYFDFLRKKKRAADLQLERLDEPGWFSGFSRTVSLAEMDKVVSINDKIANPGPFSGEVDFFSLANESAALSNDIFTNADEYRAAVTNLSGIKVYRDGFGIPVATDWLNLGSQWTKARSYYTLKPQNTLGYIAISAKDNSQLQEKTDREGFTDNPYFRNFYSLLDAFVGFSADAQQFLRRGYNEYRRAKTKETANVPEIATPESISQNIGATLSRASYYQHKIADSSTLLKTSIAEADRLATQLNGSNPAVERGEVQQLLRALRKDIDDASSGLIEAEKYLAEASHAAVSSSVLTDQIKSLNEQIQQVYEIIGLGLTAEALSHEINNVITQLAQRTQQLSRHLKTAGLRDSRIAVYVEYVNSAISALRRQMIFLAPSLRYARERRELIDMNEFGNELIQHYTAHFANQPIGFTVQKGTGRTGFKVEMNKGKLIQIIDNLVLNSEYWIKESIRTSRISRGLITLKLHRPMITIEDNGPGIDPMIEHSLFEPFVSTKGGGKGRGLGLYIAQQLLKAEGCDIRLSSQRNQQGRLYVFELDLGGVARP